VVILGPKIFGLWWSAVVCGGLRWSVVVCGVQADPCSLDLHILGALPMSVVNDAVYVVILLNKENRMNDACSFVCWND